MVRVPEREAGPTGGGVDDTHDAVSDAQEAAREIVARHVTDDSVPAGTLPDGGLFPQTVRWLESTGGTDLDAALEYDRKLREQKRVEGELPLPPAAGTGGPGNFSRSVRVNEARKALAEYRELENQTDE